MKKILILSANPKNTTHLRLDEEVREIKKTLQLSPHRDEFQIITESAVQVDDLTCFLSHHQPTIVHFSGHGSGTDGLILENQSGQSQLVSTQALAKLFDLFQQQIECVLLNACYSEEQATAIHQHIDCVVGMNQAIGDAAAIKFSVGFYTGLMAKMNYQDCFEMGCTSVDLQGIPEYLTPKIKNRRRRDQTEKPTNLLKSNKDNGIINNKNSSNRSVSIGSMERNLGSPIYTGDRNKANINVQQVNLPAPVSINIKKELKALREILTKLETSDCRKIENAFEDAQEELKKPKPDKNEVGMALERALNYAQKAEGFAGVIAKLQPHLTNTIAWLGENWHKLLNSSHL